MHSPGAIVRPMDLRRTARAVAANRGAKGAIIICVNDEGVRVGIAGLTAGELCYALCAAINSLEGRFEIEQGQG